MTTLQPVLLGALGIALLTASLFFLKFWIRTRDPFFAWFSLSFLIEAISQVALAWVQAGDEREPLFYLLRLGSFALIAFAVVQKNRPKRPR